MFELFVVSLLVVGSIAVQAWMGVRNGKPLAPRTFVLALYLWALLTLFWFAPGGLYFSFFFGPVAVVPFAVVSLSGLVLGVRLLMAASYLLRGVAAEARIARIVRHSHLHHLAVVAVFSIAGAYPMYWSRAEPGVCSGYGCMGLFVILFVSVACSIGGLIGASLGRVGLSETARLGYSASDAEEAA